MNPEDWAELVQFIWLVAEKNIFVKSVMKADVFSVMWNKELR